MENKMEKTTGTEIDDDQVLDIDEEQKEEEAYVRYEITTYPSDFTLLVLYNKWKNNEITIPGFQRQFVWDQDRASMLIESFLLGLPVPNVFFYVDRNNKSVVIDGQQRLMTVFYFFEGYFGPADEKGRRKIFKLTGLKEDNPFAGKSYNDLKDTDNGIKFRDSVLRAMNILQLSPRGDDTAIYHIFERLNKGGVSLTPQEVRNCVYRGGFNNLLFELNRDQSWRKILGKNRVDIHYKDVELVLRVIALYKNHGAYESPMKEYLNKFMALNQEPSHDWLESVAKRYRETSALVIARLGERPFRPFGPINTSMLDSTMSVLMEHYEHVPDNLAERFAKLKSQNLFVKFGTNSTRAVKDRIREVKSILIG